MGSKKTDPLHGAESATDSRAPLLSPVLSRSLFKYYQKLSLTFLHGVSIERPRPVAASRSRLLPPGARVTALRTAQATSRSPPTERRHRRHSTLWWRPGGSGCRRCTYPTRSPRASHSRPRATSQPRRTCVQVRYIKTGLSGPYHVSVCARRASLRASVLSKCSPSQRPMALSRECVWARRDGK